MAALCDAILAVGGGDPLRAEVEAIAERLDAPLTLAVAGRVSAGKSTLVNALLGRVVAATGVAETTRIVTAYRHGYPERVDVIGRTAPPRTLGLTAAGAVPSDVGASAGDVERLDVHLSDDVLRELTIIDTPGIGSATAGAGERTRDALNLDARSVRAAGGADALLFVLNGAARQDDLSTLEAFRAVSGGTRSSVASAVAVLSKADRIDPDAPDPWIAAEGAARRHEEALRTVVAAVVPVIGLLAETAAAGVLGEREADDLRRLAEVPEDAVARALVSGDRFLRADLPLPEATRRRLLEILDLYGIGCAVRAVRTGSRGAAALCADLFDLSGVRLAGGVLRDGIARRADPLKASAALAALDRALHADGLAGEALERMRDELERVRLDPEMSRLGLIGLLEEVARGELRLTADEVGEVRRLASETAPARRLGLAGDAGDADRSAAVVAAVARWRAREATAAWSGSEAAACALVRRCYEHLWVRPPGGRG